MGFLRHPRVALFEHANVLRGFPKHEVKYGARATKRTGASKRLGCADMMNAPRLGHVSSKGHEG
jgi:hypothetical protein